MVTRSSCRSGRETRSGGLYTRLQFYSASFAPYFTALHFSTARACYLCMGSVQAHLHNLDTCSLTHRSSYASPKQGGEVVDILAPEVWPHLGSGYRATGERSGARGAMFLLCICFTGVGVL